jgi:hypothetical protein
MFKFRTVVIIYFVPFVYIVISCFLLFKRNVIYHDENAKDYAHYVNGNFPCSGSEVDISECLNAISETDCAMGNPVYIDCSKTEIDTLLYHITTSLHISPCCDW